jgi:hypothetical protein
VTRSTEARIPSRAVHRLASLCWLTWVACGTPPGLPPASRPGRGGPHRASDVTSGAPSPTRTVSAVPTASVADTTPGPDTCRTLVRPGCASLGAYVGSVDHWVALECSTLFELGPELALTGAPRPLAPGLALIEPAVRARSAVGSWATVDFTRDRPRTKRLVLGPAPTRLLSVVQDPERPILLGTPRCRGDRCPAFGLWILGGQGDIRQQHYVGLPSTADLERVSELAEQHRAVLSRELELEMARRAREACMMSSVGCEDEGRGAPAPRPPEELGPSWPLPGCGVRVQLERAPGGISLVRRTEAGAPLERWLLLSHERAEYIGPPRLTEPTQVPGGYLALLVADNASIHAALVRLDEQGKLLGAPVRVATLDQGVWLGGCSDRTCLVAVAHGSQIVGRVVRLVETSASPCESQAAVVYP